MNWILLILKIYAGLFLVNLLIFILDDGRKDDSDETHSIKTILKRLLSTFYNANGLNTYRKVFRTSRINENVRILDSAEYKEGILSDKVTCRNDCRVVDVNIGGYIQWQEVTK